MSNQMNTGTGATSTHHGGLDGTAAGALAGHEGGHGHTGRDAVLGGIGGHELEKHHENKGASGQPGMGDKITGKIQEGVGKMTGNPEQVMEGAAKQGKQPGM